MKANTPLMTEFVREIRSILDEGSRKKNRRLLLSVRVPLRLGQGEVLNAHNLSPDLGMLRHRARREEVGSRGID